MKKGKIIALALAAGITFMGAGYAAWTDSVTIQSTVATGKLQVDIDRTSTATFANITNTDNDNVASAGVGDITEIDANKGVKVTFDNLYPGATGHAEIYLDNISTIPVKFDDALTVLDMPSNSELDELVFTSKLVVNGTEYDLSTVDLSTLTVNKETDMKVIIDVELPDGATGTEGASVDFEFEPHFKQFNQ
ncbi:hypothetical protein [Oceanirhabdus seepicola]|uniref:Uncharacterized protein n=1 Tax=Oceanirhabdus seepicola TaxID=2828781 RepID=A0A9J6P210_9CLOT|nr:hypothetical protein [Oceanirhabdus seepicola]MCM1990230.1 hypothetical protein [Oceanirhabdus seepicola]